MRIFLRALFACVLLIGGVGADWAPSSASVADTCCCGMLPGPHHSCPCQKPESPQGGSQNGCGGRTQPGPSPMVLLQRLAQASTPREEAAPTPDALARHEAVVSAIPGREATAAGARDEELGRHLAQLRRWRI